MSELTPMQRRVVECFAAGLTVIETADRLDISPWTVRNHMSQAQPRLPDDFYPAIEGRTRLLMYYAVTASQDQLSLVA